MRVDQTPEAWLRRNTAQRQLVETLRQTAHRRTRMQRWARRLIRR